MEKFDRRIGDFSGIFGFFEGICEMEMRFFAVDSEYYHKKL